MEEEITQNSHPGRRKTLVCLFIILGALVQCFMGFIFALGHVFGSDSWPEEVNAAMQFFNLAWAIGMLISLILLVCVCRQCENRGVWALFGVTTIACFASADYYLIMVDNFTQNPDAVPIQTWILACVPFCFWVTAIVIGHRKPHGARNTDELEASADEPLIAI